jgi:hypothetical protein
VIKDIKNYIQMNIFSKITSFLLLIFCFQNTYITGQTYIMLPTDGIGDLGVSSSQTAPTPYRSDQDHSRFQTIYTRNEMIMGGAPSNSGCDILSVGFNIAQVINAPFYNSGSGLVNYTIKMRNIPANITAVGNSFQPIDDSHIVKTPFNLNISVISSTGFHDFMLDAPFVWDGTGNILIDVCYGVNDGIASGATTRGQVRLHSWGNFTNSAVTRREFSSNSINICGGTGNNIQQANHKPVARFGFVPENVEPSCNFSIIPANPVICAGQSLQLTANGAAVSYSWSPSTGLSATSGTLVNASPASTTTYTITGTNGTCTTIQTVTVTVNQATPLNISQTPESAVNLCEGPITLSIPTGFTNIVWSNGTTGQNSIVVTTPGSYSVVANNTQGCASSSETINISSGNIPTVSITPSENLFLCSGTVNLTASPGLSNYIWSNGASGQTITIDSPGEFYVSAQNNENCTGQSEPVIINPAYEVDVEISAPLTSMCEGEQVIISTSQSFPTYQWSNGANGSAITVQQAGNYFLTVSDNNGCEGTSESIEINISESPIAGFAYLQSDGYTVDFTNSSQGASSYFWNFGGTNTSTQENPSFTYPFEGFYPVTLIAINDCGSDTILVNIEVLKLSTGLTPETNNWAVFPNPFQDMLSIQPNKIVNENISISMLNILGQEVYKSIYFVGNLSPINIPVGHLSKGVYFVQMNTKNERISYKVIKK